MLFAKVYFLKFLKGPWKSSNGHVKTNFAILGLIHDGDKRRDSLLKRLFCFSLPKFFKNVSVSYLQSNRP